MTGAHVSLDELSDAQEGLVEPSRAAEIQSHLAGCVGCRDQAALLAEVTAVLAAEVRPVMPESVAARLDQVVSAEGDRRDTHRAVRSADSSMASPRPRSTLGEFGRDLPLPSRRRWLVPALAAAVAAGVVGFGGYVLSANAGLNEPPLVATVSSSELAAQAGPLDRRLGLNPHRFSRAWQCARQVTDGRIIGLANASVDGTLALLVYTRSGDDTLVTVVTGCDTGTPTAGPSAVLRG